MGPAVGNQVILVLSLDPSGQLRWEKTYPTGGFAGALLWTLEPATDGNYLLGAKNYDDNRFPIPPAWVLKLDAAGNVLWQKVFGIQPEQIHATPDAGAILTGFPVCAPVCNQTILKLDAAGNIAWQKQYVFGSNTGLDSARPSADGGYLVTGTYAVGTGYNALLMKLDSSGNVAWQRGYTSSVCTSIGAGDILPVAGGGALMSVGCGYNTIVKLDQSGAIQWQESLKYQQISLVLYLGAFSPTLDGGYVTAGSVGSLSGTSALVALKVGPNGELQPCPAIKAQSPGLAPTIPTTVQASTASIGTADTTIVPGSVNVSVSPTQLMLGNACLY